MVNVEIIVVGNEVLLGLVQDTNSNYLCRIARGPGVRVRRITVVADDLDEIAGEIRGSLARSASLIFTCGGLGPTEDDMTLAGVARACDLPLVLDEAARDFVRRRYDELAAQFFVRKGGLTDERLKMALLPRGATMIENPVGTAPAIVLDFQGSRIVSLPGVPAEMRGIVEGPLRKWLSPMLESANYVERELFADCGDESILAPALRVVAAAHPDVYIKSHAGKFGAAVRFRITFSASAQTEQEALAMIEKARGDLREGLNAAGIATE
jgi:molybdenum cofactor synthesis domain-containing protein